MANPISGPAQLPHSLRIVTNNPRDEVLSKHRSRANVIISIVDQSAN